MSVNGNIAARKQCDAIMDLAVDAAVELNRKYGINGSLRLFASMREKLDKLCPRPKDEHETFAKMDDAESIRFGNTLVTFGAHEHSRVDEVPLCYWDWLLGNESSMFIKQLNRYVASDRVRKEPA